MRVLFVDEDVGQMRAWRAAVRVVAPEVEVEVIRYADEAFDAVKADPLKFDLVIVDLMLAVLDAQHQEFSPRLTRGYLTAGLLLVQRLIDEVKIPPERLIIFTQATSHGIFRTAHNARTAYNPHFKVWKKSEHLNAFEFGEKIADLLAEQHEPDAS